MKKILVILILVLGMAPFGWAHFQLLIPSRDIVRVNDPHQLSFEIIFTHPAEGGPVMEMVLPKAFGVVIRGQREDLLASLKRVVTPAYPCRKEGPLVSAYQASYSLRRPGDHLFYLVPAPYFEPAEEKFIQQVTKVIVNAFGAEEGWDQPIGLPVEIVPLTRPYGLFAGELFRGLVLKNSKPLPYAEVEVEFYNRQCQLDLEDPFVTQVIKTDENGIFSFALPWAGWWGFSALTEGGNLKRGQDIYPLELDAVIWIRAYERPQKAK